MIEKDESMKDEVIQQILEEKKGRAKTEEILRKAIEYKAKILEFKEPDPDNMLEVEEKEEVSRDIRLLKLYNQGIESYGITGSIISIYEEDNYYENVIKIEFKGKEVVVGFSKEIDYSSNSSRYYYDFTFSTNIDAKKRLHVQSGSYFKTTPYDRCFIDYEKHLDKYDMENDQRYREHFSDRMEKLKNKESLNLEKYKLSDSEKEFLMEILVSYNFPFSFVLKDGILCIHSSFDTFGLFYKGYIKKVCYFMDCMMKIIERFMYL